VSRMDLAQKKVVLADAILISGIGNQDRLAAQNGFLGTIEDLDDWVAQQKVSPKDLKTADRQTLVLLRTLHGLLERNPTLDREVAAVPLAVGPARTNLDALERWAQRIVPGESFPLVQSGAAIGLLPNMPLSWVSIRQQWRGEGAVWAGFEEAGFEATVAAFEALQSGIPEAVVAVVSCPDKYFVPRALNDRGYHSDIGCPDIGCPQVYDPHFGCPQIGYPKVGYPEIGVALRLVRPDIFRGEGLLISSFRGPSEGLTDVEAMGFQTPFRREWGNPLTASFPAALALAFSARVPGLDIEVASSAGKDRWFSACLEGFNV